MFDIGFMELVLIAIVSLVVIGPERLPGAVRTASLWIGRAKRSFNQVKTEIEREINADEIRRQLHNESILADLDKAKKKADALMNDTRKNIDDLNAEVNATLKEEERKLTGTSATPSTTATKPQTPSILPPKPPEPAAAAVDDPARFDEDYVAPEPAATPESATAVNSTAVKAAPVEDFYNNPPAGTIRLKGGSYTSVPPKSAEPEDHQSKE